MGVLGKRVCASARCTCVLIYRPKAPASPRPLFANTKPNPTQNTVGDVHDLAALGNLREWIPPGYDLYVFGFQVREWNGMVVVGCGST
jgi:hypothetical protein